MDQYILDGHEPVPAPDLIAWGAWMETAERHVADEMRGAYRISTVFLGLDHGIGTGRVLLFETMIFGDGAGDPMHNDCRRYTTWGEAEAGHAEEVARVERFLATGEIEE